MIMKDKTVNNIILYLFLFDSILLPTMHVGSIPWKFGWMIGPIAVFCHFVNVKVKVGSRYIFDGHVEEKSVANFLVRDMIFIIMLSILGELTCLIYITPDGYKAFFQAEFFYLVMIGSMIIGYACYNFNKDVLVWFLVFFCSINITFSLLRFNTPNIIKRIYGINALNEAEAFSKRITGTMGNPNATLCVMNVIFMSIIVFMIRGEIKLNRVYKLMIVIFLPIITNMFVSSRGEMIVTVLLECVLLYWLLKKKVYTLQVKIFFVAGIILAFLLILVMKFVLVDKFATVEYGLERLTEIFGGTGNSDPSNSILKRPFLCFEDFWPRFIRSPFWGTGFSSNADSVFKRSSSSMHNDWLGVMSSTGIMGLLIWLHIGYVSVKKCGIFFCIPFFVTALSNTFIGSCPAMVIYFITVMCVIRKQDECSCEESDDEDSNCYCSVQQTS